MVSSLKPAFIAANSDTEGNIYVYGIGCQNGFKIGVRAVSPDWADYLIKQPEALDKIDPKVADRLRGETANYIGRYQ